MYLVDTNILWLERLLEQERSEEVAKFLNSIPTEKLFITDFSFHSISIILTKFKKFEILTDLTQKLSSYTIYHIKITADVK